MFASKTTLNMCAWMVVNVCVWMRGECVMLLSLCALGGAGVTTNMCVGVTTISNAYQNHTRDTKDERYSNPYTWP